MTASVKMVQKRSWLHARSGFVLSRFPLSQPLYFSGKACYGAKLAAVAFIVLLLFAFGDYWLLQCTLWMCMRYVAGV